ncbi:MAG: hypothetical protein ACX939_00060, partial [Hyphococcus sp.]
MIAKLIGAVFAALFLLTGHAFADASVSSAMSCSKAPQKIDSDLQVKIDRLIEDAVGRGFAGGVTVIRDGIVVYDRVAGSASM